MVEVSDAKIYSSVEKIATFQNGMGRWKFWKYYSIFIDDERTLSEAIQEMKNRDFIVEVDSEHPDECTYKVTDKGRRFLNNSER